MSQFRQAVIATATARRLCSRDRQPTRVDVAMDFRVKLKIAAGRRLAARGGNDPPPIGTWERLGWDEWHGRLAWERRQREERENQAHIMTGQFTPIRSRAPGTWLPGKVSGGAIWKVVAARIAAWRCGGTDPPHL